MRHVVIAAVLSVGSIAAGQELSPTPRPQPPTSSQSPTFEVASIKVNKSEVRGRGLGFGVWENTCHAAIGVTHVFPSPEPRAPSPECD